MKITMLQAAPGSIDGIRVATYESGTEYDLTATDGARDLAQAFVGAGLAVEVDAKPATVEAQEGPTDKPAKPRKTK